MPSGAYLSLAAAPGGASASSGEFFGCNVHRECALVFFDTRGFGGAEDGDDVLASAEYPGERRRFERHFGLKGLTCGHGVQGILDVGWDELERVGCGTKLAEIRFCYFGHTLALAHCFASGACLVLRGFVSEFASSERARCPIRRLPVQDARIHPRLHR
jgi:hypothetical protein